MSVTPLFDPGMAQSQINETEMRSRQREIEQTRRGLNAGTQKSKEEKLRESCEGFEAMFMQKMWEGMRASLPQDGLMQSRDEKHWQSMYDQELGKNMAKAGGIGLADMMMSQLSRNLQSASDVAASSSRRRPMDIAPAPLLSETQPKAAPAVALAAPTTQDKAAGLDMYSDKAPDTAPTETPAEANTTAAMPATPPEVQVALANMENITTLAQTVGDRNAQPPLGAETPGQMPATQAATASIATNSTNPKPQGRRSPHREPNVDDVQHITRTQRQTAVTRSPRATASTMTNSAGANIAEISATQTASPFTGQNVPMSPLSEVATDLLKNQLGEPTVKTKL